MPTARELLEQADALMKRNRLAPSAQDDGIPMLTEAVPVPGSAAPEPRPVTRALYSELDDVPLLTDAVEEIEAPSILDEPPDIEEPPEFDDPAVWTDTLTGTHSVLDDDRIALPPTGPLAEVTKTPGDLPVPSAPVERSAEWDAAVAPYPVESIEVEAPAAPLEEVGLERIADVPEAGAAPATPAATFDDREFEALPRDDDPVPPTGAEPHGPTAGVHAGPAPVDQATVIAATPFEFAREDAPPPDAGHLQDHASSALPGQPAPPALERYDTGVDATLPGVGMRPVATPAPPTPGEDDARWSALAEEIRMQVLQRIDLFTDTGLREQLAARMQPIVDRASADLVATINQHVGVLLRAYVAEAIEREIERWRAERP